MMGMVKNEGLRVGSCKERGFNVGVIGEETQGEETLTVTTRHTSHRDESRQRQGAE